MMRPLRLAELQLPLQAQLSGEDGSFNAVSTDSRAVESGDLFVALKGENFDGHDYLTDVAAAGAVGALVSTPAPIALPQLLVDDTQRALGKLGAYNRSLYEGPLVAITGSSGKTSVKNMIGAVLGQRGPTLATQGNYNNEIGVPLTLLRLEPEFDFAVVEMGAAGRGHIAWLCELGRPNVAILLNAMPAHLEGFGSVEDVAEAKGEIFDGLGAGDYAVINADQPWAARWRRRAGAAHILDFGLQQAAAITAANINMRALEGVSFTASTPAGEIAIRLSLPGMHNVANALATIAAGIACGLTLTEIRDGLESVRPVPGRLQHQASASGATVIDDCYNANPGSVRAAIDTLAACSGRRTLILGMMGELGEASATFHREIGEYARDAGIDAFYGVGEALAVSVEAFGDGATFLPDSDTAQTQLAGAFDASDTVLIKGSRSAKMEEILQAVLAQSPGRAESC